MRITLCTDHISSPQFAKRMLFLAYEASTVEGMGYLQAKEGATEQEVSEQFTFGMHGAFGCVTADYVYGRMVKLRFSFTTPIQGLILRSEQPHIDWQSWARTYKTNKELLLATAKSLGMDEAHYTISKE